MIGKIFFGRSTIYICNKKMVDDEVFVDGGIFIYNIYIHTHLKVTASKAFKKMPLLFLFMGKCVGDLYIILFCKKLLGEGLDTKGHVPPNNSKPMKKLA